MLVRARCERAKFVVSADKETGLGADDRSGAAVLLTTVLDHSAARSCPIRRSRFCGPCRKKSACSVPATFASRCSASRSWRSISTAARPTQAENRRDRRLSHDDRNPRPREPRRQSARGRRQRDRHRVARDRRFGARAAGTGSIEEAKAHGTSNVGVIAGGEATNVVTDHVHTPRRSPQPRSEISPADRQGNRIGVQASGRCRAQRRGQACGTRPIRRPARLRIVSLAPRRAVRRRRQPRRSRPKACEPELAITNGGLDANWLTAHGIPTVTLGCGQQNIHTAERRTRYCRVSAGPANRTSASHGADFSVS